MLKIIPGRKTAKNIKSPELGGNKMAHVNMSSKVNPPNVVPI